ncbi:MAG: tetraacyldisaccharide 4'-kinase [Desulfurivibrionaceae bacterium]|nr:tetraacyldisaccharide 4'-kinase [Desulfurivibrionaceae bacterium]
MSRKKEKKQDLRLNPLFTIGRPFAPLYGAAMAMRASFYARGLFRRHHLGVPVVSVGNLTMGGTGKTPMVIYLARLLAPRKVAIVSRGYGGKAGGKVNVVSDGQAILLDARQAGDEPYLMASVLPGVPVITGRQRILASHYGVEKLGAGLLILDDGFQHLAMARDLDMVLFKVDSFLGNNRVFPGGDMREPLAALGRAHCFVLTCVDAENKQRAETLRHALEKRFEGIPVFFSEYRPACLVDGQGYEYPLSALADKKVGAFCGLAQPAYFEKSLALAGLTVSTFSAYPDHHLYRARQIAALVDSCRERFGVEALVTTEKDLVKVKEFSTDMPLFALRMDVVMEKGFDDFVCRRLSVAESPHYKA